MTTEGVTKVRQMPKGGRKGGTIFPRVALKDALVHARKLVSKTHTSAQPQDVIFSGVVGAKGGKGSVRMSALKQFGFLKGDIKSGFAADELAKEIAAAPDDELEPLYRRAILKPTVFKKLFDTFHGDVVTKAKLKQRAADLKVHPDETDTCVELYVSGMTTAGLVSVEGDRVTHVASSELSIKALASTAGEVSPAMPDEFVAASDFPESDADEGDGADGGSNGGNGAEAIARLPTPAANGVQAQLGPRAVFNVNVTLDSSMDIEKLQKQLELLKRFGAI